MFNLVYSRYLGVGILGLKLPVFGVSYKMFEYFPIFIQSDFAIYTY